VWKGRVPLWESPPPLLHFALLLARRVEGEEDTKDLCMSDKQEEEEDPDIDLDDVMQIMMDLSTRSFTCVLE